jgi:hypothetical protein
MDGSAMDWSYEGGGSEGISVLGSNTLSWSAVGVLFEVVLSGIFEREIE